MTSDDAWRPGPGSEPPPGRWRALGPVPARAARENASDEELLAAHVDGDTQAFNEIIRRHRIALRVVALRVLADHDDAHDAVQEALLRAFRGADRYRGDGDVLAWLRTIVENASKTVARTRDRNGREVVGLPPEDDGGTGPSSGGGAGGPEQTVMRFAEAEERLGRVEEPFRRTFILVKVRGFSYAEAAAIEQVPVGTIRSRLSRAKAILSHPPED